MRTYTLDLSDSASARLIYHTTFLKEVAIMYEIPADANCAKVIGTIDFNSVGLIRNSIMLLKGK